MSRILSVPTSAPRRGLRLLAAALVASAILSLGVLVIRQSGSTSNAPAQAAFPLHDGDLRPAGSGVDWALVADPAFDPSTSVALLNWDSNSPAIDWVAGGSGTIVARMTIAASAFAFNRRSANEFLVSDSLKRTPQDAIPDEGTRLLVFDTRSAMTLKTVVNLPKRARYPVYGYPVVMSADENHLVYVRYDFQPGAPGCDRDAARCDSFSLVPIDANHGFSLGAPVQLAPGCQPTVQPLGASGFVAVCKDDTATFFDGDLKTVSQVSLIKFARQHTDQWGNAFSTPLSLATLDPTGRTVGIFHDGLAVRIDNGKAELGQALPASAWIAGRVRWLDGTRLAIPYKWTMTTGGVDGVAVFNIASFRVESQTAFPHATDALALNDKRALTLRGGTISSIDMPSATEVQIGAAPSTDEVLIP